MLNPRLIDTEKGRDVSNFSDVYTITKSNMLQYVQSTKQKTTSFV